MNRRIALLLPLAGFIVLAGLLLRGLSLDSETLPSALLGKPFPEFAVTRLEDETAPLSKANIVGRPALVNVWATWCGSCRVEHPYLNHLAAQGVPIVGLNYKDNRAKAIRWLADLGDPYSINLYDGEGRLGFDLGVYGAPETYLIDAKGTIIYKHVGVVDLQVWETKFEPEYKRLVAEGA